MAKNCLRGLLTLILTSRHGQVVGEAIVVVRRILQASHFSTVLDEKDDEVKTTALKRLLILLMTALEPAVADMSENPYVPPCARAMRA